MPRPTGYFSLNIQHGQGWYELWKEGSGILPSRPDGDRIYAPDNPEKWNHGHQPLQKDGDPAGFFPADSRDNLILTTWEEKDSIRRSPLRPLNAARAI